MHIIVTSPRRVAMQAAVFLLLAGTLSPLIAQPTLTFKRVTVNWPTIEPYFAAGCDGNPAYNMSKDNFRIQENGEDVGAFTLWCPDPTIRCAVSMAVVLDVSGSMSGAPFDRIRGGAHAMVDVFDGVMNEMTIVAAAADVFIPCSMTTVKPQLHACIDGLRGGGTTRIWDAVDVGLDELLRAGTNQCRALLLFTDGGDLGSAITINDIIAKANRNRIRIFTISEGVHTHFAALDEIAQLTGGHHYHEPNAAKFAAIYHEITAIIFPDFQECIVTYERGCADGSLRTVEMQLYFVTVLTPAGCEAVSDPVDVPMRIVSKPTITRGGDVLSTGDARSWQWYRNDSPIPGATQRSHRLKETGWYTVRIVDSAGCRALSDPFTVTVLSNDAPSTPEQLVLYPDPATDRLHVRIPGPFAEATLALYSLLGQRIHSERASGGESRVVTLATSGYPRGVYVLRVTAGGRMWTRRVVLR